MDENYILSDVEENWRIVPGYENYSVSDLGRVRNNSTGDILKPSIREDGRLQVTLPDANQLTRRVFYVHKLVYDIFSGDSHRKWIRHIDGNKCNNAINNLKAFDSPTGGKGKARPAQSRKVKIKETGDIYKSETACALAIGGRKAGVSMCLNGYMPTYKGYTFEYVE